MVFDPFTSDTGWVHCQRARDSWLIMRRWGLPHDLGHSHGEDSVKDGVTLR